MAIGKIEYLMRLMLTHIHVITFQNSPIPIGQLA